MTHNSHTGKTQVERKIFTIFAFLIIFSIPAFSQWVKLNAPDGGNFKFITAFNGKTWTIVGRYLYNSMDEGQTWELVSQNHLPENLTYIASKNDTIYGVASYYSANIIIEGFYRSLDEGVTWEQLSSTITDYAPMARIELEFDQNGIWMGPYFSDDGGYNWTEKKPSFPFWYSGAASNNGRIVWGAVPINYPPPGPTYQSGIHISKDGGSTWSTKQPGGNTYYNDPFLLDSLIICSSYNQVYISKDIGEHWDSIPYPFAPSGSDGLYFPGLTDTLIFLKGGHRYFTTNKGYSWQDYPVNVSLLSGINQIGFPNGNTWLATSNQLYRQTTPGDFMPSSHNINQASAWQMAGTPNYLVASTSNGFYRTSDEGETWELLSQNSPVYGIIANDSRLFGFGQSHDVLFSDDDGSTWSQLAFFPQDYIIDKLKIIDGFLYVLVSTKVYKLDAQTGATLDIFEVPTEPVNYIEDFAICNNRLLILKFKAELYYSDDSGMTWNMKSVPFDGYTDNLIVSGNNLLIYGSPYSLAADLLVSNNCGDDFMSFDTGLPGNWQNDYLTVNPIINFDGKYCISVLDKNINEGGKARLYTSVPGVASPWENITGNLPACVSFDKTVWKDNLYVSMDGEGIWKYGSILHHVDTTLCAGIWFLGQQVWADTTLFDTSYVNNLELIVNISITVLPNFTTEVDTAVVIGTNYIGVTILSDTTLIKTFTAQNGCDSTVTTHVSILTGTENLLKDEMSIQVFPNPTSDNFTIEMDLPEAMALSIEAVDMLGRRVAVISENEVFQQGKQRLRVHARDWPSGVYLLELRTGSQAFFEKIIRQ